MLEAAEISAQKGRVAQLSMAMKPQQLSIPSIPLLRARVVGVGPGEVGGGQAVEDHGLTHCPICLGLGLCALRLDKQTEACLREQALEERKRELWAACFQAVVFRPRTCFGLTLGTLCSCNAKPCHCSAFFPTLVYYE